MTFKIDDVAREYVYQRFPSASIPEKEKIIRDWVNKMNDSKHLVADFTARVGSPTGKKILDVGCGNGGLSIAFWMAGAKVTGIDIEKSLYDIALKQKEAYGADVDFHLYDGNKLPFQNDVFDMAVSVSVLEHTSDPVLYLAEILRVLKPGGFLYLGFPNKLWPMETHTRIPMLTYLPSKLRPYLVSMLKRNPLEENNLHFYNYFNLMNMLKKSGGDYVWGVIPEDGKSKNIFKIVIKKVLGVFGLSYKVFLPHILVILKKETKNEK